MASDPLTSLHDSRAFMAELERLAREAPDGETCWLLVADIDDFKAVNDRYGHQAGDGVLVRVGQAIRGALPAGDFVARVGGDEFAAILDGLSMLGARTTAEDAVAAVEALDLPSRVTASIGLAGWLPAAEPFDEAFRAADNALYDAKKSGGNQVHVSGIDG